MPCLRAFLVATLTPADRPAPRPELLLAVHDFAALADREARRWQGRPAVFWVVLDRGADLGSGGRRPPPAEDGGAARGMPA